MDQTLQTQQSVWGNDEKPHLLLPHPGAEFHPCPWSWCMPSHSHAVKSQEEKDVAGSIQNFLQKCQWLLGADSKGAENTQHFLMLQKHTTSLWMPGMRSAGKVSERPFKLKIMVYRGF